MNKVLEQAIANLNKTYGAGSIISFDSDYKQNVEVVSSGSLQLDAALGVGGFPKGRIIEIYGPESSGKTTLAIHVIAEAQKKHPEKVVAFIDLEHALDPTYAQAIGVDLTNWIFSQPSCGEEALDITEKLVRTKEISVLVVDSVAALTPKAEIEGEFGESKMGLQARLMSQGMRKLVGVISDSGTIVIFINQLRDKIGVMFGNPETTTGGNALKFYASVRLDVRKVTTNKEGEEAVSNRTRVKVIKNKVAPPFKMCEFDIIFGVGIDQLGEIIDVACEVGIIVKSGSWFSYRDTKLGQGKDMVKQLFKDNDELVEEIKQQCRIFLKMEEPTEEQRQLMESRERERVWSLFEDRLIKVVDKYRIDATAWMESIKDTYEEVRYKGVTDAQLNKIIKEFNESR